MQIEKNNFYEQRGAGLLEVLLVLAVIGIMMPFAYNTMSDATRDIANSVEAQRVMDWADPVMAWVRKNQADWPSSAQIEFDQQEISAIGTGKTRLLTPFSGFIDKRQMAGGFMIDAYLAFHPNGIDEMRSTQIASQIGPDAAVVGEGGTAVSASGWSVSSDDLSQGDLVFRISDILSMDESLRYLHRTYLDDESVNAMQRDLMLGKHNLLDAGAINAQNFNAVNATTWFAETPLMNLNEVYFRGGANLDAGKATLNAVRVSGDVNGFRRITANNFTGSGGSEWSARADIVADNAEITGSVRVSRDLNIRAEYGGGISGFAAIQAGSLSTSFISADQMFFAGSFGVTVSSELLHSTSGYAPLKLGSWSFPSSTGAGPAFTTLTLVKISGGDVGEILSAPDVREFEPIMADGWRSR